MDCKLFDSELKVMQLLWQEGPLPAKELARRLGETVGWNKNTTYTIIKKCIDKGAVEREEPNFVCRALVTQEEVQGRETDQLIDRMFGGSSELFFSSFLRRRGLDEGEARRLLELIEKEK